MSSRTDASKQLGKRKHRQTTDEQPRKPKKPRKDVDAVASAKSEDTPTIERNLAKTSLLQQEERAFPRGGASLLTPLERKQIQIQATKDVLFEERGQNATKDNAEDSAEEQIDGYTRAAKPKAAKRSKTLKKQKAKDADHGQALDPKIRTDGLKPKRLVPGSLVLGMVSRINANDVALDIPNSLRGTISITAMSKTITQKLQALVGKEESEQDKDAQETQDDIDLNEHFSMGQYLRACVISTADDLDEDTGKAKRHLQLSIDPQQTNRGMKKSDLGINTMIQASIVSVEDHGLIMDVGIEEDSIKGFMSSKEIPEGTTYADLKAGTVFLCLVTGTSSNGNVIKLSANLKKAQRLLKSEVLTTPPTVKSLLPGLAVELLVSQVSNSSIAGKLMGSIDAAADVVHSGAGSRKANIESTYKIGMKVKARITFASPGSENGTVGISVLEHILSFSVPTLQHGKANTEPTLALPIASFVEQAKIVNVEPGLGVFADVGIKNIPAFVHVSRISDGRVDSLSQSTGSYRSGTSHRARIVGYNAVDGMFSASFQKSILEQKYLRTEDVPVGELMQVTVRKIIINQFGVAGLLVNIANGINGFVEEVHMSDVHLQHPERKFKEGASVSARVISVNKDSRQIRLTLKKALVTSEASIWTKYEDVTPGSESVGTIHSIKREGAIVQFFGPVKAFLPVSQMSDAFIDDPAKHFRIGQTVRVHVLSSEPEERRVTVTCRLPAAEDAEESAEFTKLQAGQLVNGTVVEKSSDDISVELKDSKLRASLSVGHLTDGSERKNASAMKHVRVGQTMTDLLILELFPKKKSIVLSNKPSLVADAKAGRFLNNFQKINPDMTVNGFVRNITGEGVFVGFGNGLTGLLHRSRLTDVASKSIDFGLRKDQSITAKILFVDYAQSRFNLTMKDSKALQGEQTQAKAMDTPAVKLADGPVDGVSTSLGDFTIGKVTSAKISSVKDTQLNVRLAENIQGRIDVSEAFNDWEEIKDRKNPLKAFRVNQVIPVRILGIHDARNHKFLPITHRGGKVPVFELSVKLESGKSILSLDQITVGSWYAVFVNNVSDKGLWVNVSPNVRGRIERKDISEDVSLLNNLGDKFPLGSAMRVRVKNVDISGGRLDLSARAEADETPTTFDSLTVGMIVTGRVTKVTERLVMIQIGPNISGAIGLTELSDDFSKANPGIFSKHDIARVCVLDIDKANKKVVLSARPSKVLSSSLKVTDRHIASIDQLKVNDVVRGFVKNVAETGLFVSLSHNVTAFVRISELSDSFLKDWKAGFEIDRLVTGKIVAVDSETKKLQMSLKSSVVSENYVPRLTFNDLKVGQVVTGKVRKVEEFGAFILVDHSHNVSGLCHRSEMAEKRVPDARTIYEEGDEVKAIVLKIESEKRKISFGLKASYFEKSSDNESESESLEEANDDQQFSDSEDDADMDEEDIDERGGIEIPVGNGVDENLPEDNDEEMSDAALADGSGLEAGGFDWSGELQQDDSVSEAPSEPDPDLLIAKKQHGKPEFQIDQTGDLDALGPRSANDFERLLLGQRDSSSLWVQYMAFFLQLNEIDQARNIAERALKEINIREQEEKLNVWVAYLNLENAYGTDDSIEEVFTRACEVNDTQDMHERLTSIYIESGKHKEADDLFQTMTRKKGFTPDPKLWLNYANFVMGILGETERARGMLERAMKSVPSHLHRDLVSKFAQLEFRCKNGDPERGRTMFERLLDTYPKRWDLWDILIEMELLQGERGNVRGLYERMTSLSMKNRRAKYAFKKWLEFEEEEGDQKKIDHVGAKAADYVERQKS